MNLANPEDTKPISGPGIHTSINPSPDGNEVTTPTVEFFSPYFYVGTLLCGCKALMRFCLFRIFPRQIFTYLEDGAPILYFSSMRIISTPHRVVGLGGWQAYSRSSGAALV